MTDTMRKLFIEILFIGKAKERKKKKKKSIIGRFWLEEVINDVLCIYIYIYRNMNAKMQKIIHKIYIKDHANDNLLI